MEYKLETDRYNFLKLFLIFFFTDTWPTADIRMATDTDISNFAYRYICRYFNKKFWLKLMWIAYSPDLRQPN